MIDPRVARHRSTGVPSPRTNVTGPAYGRTWCAARRSVSAWKIARPSPVSASASPGRSSTGRLSASASVQNAAARRPPNCPAVRCATANSHRTGKDRHPIPENRPTGKRDSTRSILPAIPSMTSRRRSRGARTASRSARNRGRRTHRRETAAPIPGYVVVDDLSQTLAGREESGAQRLVPGDHSFDCAAQRLDVKIGGPAREQRNVIRRCVAERLLGEEQLFLHLGGGKRVHVDQVRGGMRLLIIDHSRNSSPCQNPRQRTGSERPRGPRSVR